jgi:hypothetical protein
VIDNHGEHSFVFYQPDFLIRRLIPGFKRFLGIPGCIAATIRFWCNSEADAYSKDPVYIYFDAGLIQISKNKNTAGIETGGIDIIT